MSERKLDGSPMEDGETPNERALRDGLAQLLTYRSLYGPKPDACPEPFTHCGDCNRWPCRMPQGPTLSEEGQRDQEQQFNPRLTPEIGHLAATPPGWGVDDLLVVTDGHEIPNTVARGWTAEDLMWLERE